MVIHVSSNHCERARNSLVGTDRHHPGYRRRPSDLSVLKISLETKVEQPIDEGIDLIKSTHVSIANGLKDARHSFAGLVEME